MTPKEFKLKYPQYAHLEGDDLWNKMEEYLVLHGEVYTADPDRVRYYFDPIILSNGVSVRIEDDSKTLWVDSQGNKGYFVKEEEKSSPDTGSHSFVIFNPSE